MNAKCKKYKVIFNSDQKKVLKAFLKDGQTFAKVVKHEKINQNDSPCAADPQYRSIWFLVIFQN